MCVTTNVKFVNYVDQWLSLMLAQVAPGATTILQGNFDLKTHIILCQ